MLTVMNDDEGSGGGDEWKHQLGTMWRMASSGLDALREVVVRSSQEGRLRVDLALYQRERRDVLLELGQTVVGLVDAGRLEVPDALRPILARLRLVEERLRSDSAQLHDNAFGAPRGFEPEAGNYDDGDEADEPKAP
jgi:hypothetical protein